MRLLFEIDTKDYDPNGKAFVRPSVRGIIIWDEKVAMVHSLKYNYYKFPGGGIEDGESMEQALLREVAEESGLQVIPQSIREYGLVHRIQKGDREDIFVQDNYYFLCDVEVEVQSQHLDDYEAEEQFTLEFVNPNHAIQTNRYVDHGPKDQIMLEREARVLELLMQEGFVQSCINGIHATNDYERVLFGALKDSFSSNMDRWYSNTRPDQVNNNFFAPNSDITVADINAAIAEQKSRGLNYVMIRMSQPMDLLCKDRFHFEEDVMYVMAMLRDQSRQWQTNGSIVIRDIQSSDIRADLLDVSFVPKQYRDAAYRNMKMVLEVAETHPEYHWLCAYKDGKRVGTVYALSHNGYVEMDDLWVEEAYRHQRIATTLIKYIADHTDGTLYLHADASATPQNMYAKMGFEILETVYEYYMEW